MGADIRVEGRTAKITGVEQLSGAAVTCTDLRAGAAVIWSRHWPQKARPSIDNLQHLDRGYENIVPKSAEAWARISSAQ